MLVCIFACKTYFGQSVFYKNSRRQCVCGIIELSKSKFFTTETAEFAVVVDAQSIGHLGTTGISVVKDLDIRRDVLFRFCCIQPQGETDA